MAVTPRSATVLLGSVEEFSAAVSGTSNTAVAWTVDGVPGGNGPMGTINNSGAYQAPAVLPAIPVMKVMATSQADPASSGTASVTVESDVRVEVSPGMASVPAGASVQLSASILSAGHPANGVNWTVAGAGCAGSTCGTISASGLYTAPARVPQFAAVMATATSVADPSQSASATMQVTAPAAISITPSNGTVALEQSVQFTASQGGAGTEEVTWSVNGITGGNTTVGTISNSPAQKGLYLAPVNMPAGRQVSISATSNANGALTASVALQLTSNIVVAITPTSATRIPGTRQTFTATIAKTSNTQITWTVNDIANGNSSAGQICQAGSNPCLAPPLAGPAGAVDYLAPGSAPIPPQVTVKAVSVADPAQSAAAVVTIAAQIAISVSPQSATLPPGQTQAFSATVAGVADQRVLWDVNGAPNGSIAEGLICLPASNPCQAPSGAISSAIEYRAPGAPPTPNVVSVRATSAADGSVQAAAEVTISTSPFITGLVPASAFAGAAEPFGLRVTGVLFAASQPGPGATIQVNGVSRATVCPSATECDAMLAPADVAAPGALAVNVMDPGMPGAPSNTVNLILAAPESTVGVISLDAASPAATGLDIAVVEPTLAGNTPPGELALLEIGQVDAETGACVLGLPPLELTRPAAGSVTLRLCAFGTALDQVTQAWFSTPASPDFAATNLDTSLGSVLLEFDATLTAGAAPGPRTLFVLTGNLDAASLTAAVEVKSP